MPVSLEIERKYLHPDLDLVRNRLTRQGATFKGRAWEKNLVLDRPDRCLRKNNALLRLRQSGETTLTLKKQPAAGVFTDNVKTMREWETPVSDKAAMLAIFEGLGYEIAFTYEKIRETWLWRGCTICLDILPFMQAVELEGEPDKIDQAARHFGLDALEPSTATYHQLHRAHRAALGLPPADDFVFTDLQKTSLLPLGTEQAKD